MPFQFMVRWIKSSATGKILLQAMHDGRQMGLATGRQHLISLLKNMLTHYEDGTPDEANFNSETGTRDAILMRLAETFLIRAEAYGRKGQYALAVADINVLRQRAAYKGGESRPNVLVEWEPKATTLAASEKAISLSCKWRFLQ